MTRTVTTDAVAPARLSDGAEGGSEHDPERELVGSLERARQAFDLATDPTDRANALLLIGKAEYRGGRLDAALGALEEANRVLSRQPGHLALECALMLGRTRRDLGRFDDAARNCTDALALARRLDSPREAEALNLLAGVMAQRGEYSEALEQLERALEIARRNGLVEREATVLDTTGVLYGFLGNYSGALAHLKQAYDLLGTIEASPRSAVANLVNLGNLYQRLGDHSEALAFLQEAREVSRDAGDATMEAAALNNIANVHRENGRWPEAGSTFEEALELARRITNRAYEIDNLDGLGQVQVALGEIRRAVTTHTEALEIAREIGDRGGEIDTLLNLGRDHLLLDDPARAREALTEGLDLAERLEQRRSIYEGHSLLAEAYEALGDVAAALQHYKSYHLTEKEVFNLESQERTRQLTVQFEVERTRHEAETYRLRNEMEHRGRQEAEALVRERTRELEEAQFEVVSRLAFAGECRDDDTGEHTRRVGRTAAAIGYALGWSEERVKLIFSAARLHDVGKIGVSDKILHKPGKLTVDEFARMRDHSVVGARILSNGHSKLLKMSEEIALSHHERWDGKGYPFGLSGEAIPETARVVAVADVLDALIHERPYKRAWPIEEALTEIERQSGQQFDPRVVAACVAVFRDGAFSPLEAEQDWLAIHQELKALPLPVTERAPGEVASKLKERYERLLAERTRDLEAAKREAQHSARQMQAMAFSDPLTGLGNRRAFESDLEDAIARAERQGERVSVLTLDLDRLKQLNDHEGHERGDAYLQAVAVAVRSQLSDVGRLYRIGGDEFVAIVSHDGSRSVHEVEARIDAAFASLPESYGAVSTSRGYATFPDEAATLDILVELSDRRMYSDKRARRGGD